MSLTTLSIVDVSSASRAGCGSCDTGGGCGSKAPEAATLGTVAEAVRGNQLARQMPRMSYMELILTDQCNLRCSYCFEKDKNPHNMSDETAMAAVDFLMEESGPIKRLTILFFGGEPLLRFDLLQKVHAYAMEESAKRGKSINWDMTTNGTLITEEKARWLAKAGVRYLLSLDGGREDHDRYRKFASGRGSFDTVAKNLPIMKRYQPWMGAKVSVTPESGPNLARSLAELHRMGINQFILGYAHGLPWTVDDLVRYEAAMYEVCELYLEKKYNKEYFRMTLFEEGEPGEVEAHGSFGCGAGRGRVCVDSYGDLYGCSKLATITGMHNGVLPFGNVFQGFTRIDNRIQFMHTDVGPRDKCRTCEFKEVCGGGCPAVNYKATGSIHDADDLGCRIVFVNQRIHAYMRERTRQVIGGADVDLFRGPDFLQPSTGGPCVES
jgi:uncharacterized protein